MSSYFAVVRRILALLGALVLVACASDDRPKPAPLEAVAHPVGVQAVWTAALGAIDFPLELRVVSGRVYAADGSGTVAAIDLANGKDLWRVALGTPLSAGVGSDGRYAAVVTRGNDLVVIEAGRELWRQHLSALTLTAPLVAGARVFAVSADRTVVAFDAASGRKLWQQARSADALVLGQAGLLTSVQDTLVVGLGGRLVGMNPNNGASRWELPAASSRGTNEVERLLDVVAGYSRVGDQLCVRAFQYAVTCFDGNTGKLAWSKPANGARGLAGDADAVYGTDGDGRYFALARNDGHLLWESQRLRFRQLTAPVLAGSWMVFGDNSGNLHFMSRQDGSLQDRLSIDNSGVEQTPVLAGRTLLVVSRRGTLYALRAQ